MTATVTPPHSVDKFDDLAPMSGDKLTRLTYGLLDIRKPDGQLWERVAELEASGMNYTERMERVKIARIAKAQGIHAEEPTRTWGFSLITGPSLVTFPNPPTVSGIIHAGERIK